MGEVDKALALKVQEPSRGSHQHIKSPAELVHLGLLAHTAEDHGATEGQIFPVGQKTLLDLKSQLTGGSQNEGADGPLALDGPGGQPLEDGGGEGAGLACACLGVPSTSRPASAGGNGALLNGGRLHIALGVQGLENGCAEAKFVERHKYLSLWMDFRGRENSSDSGQGLVQGLAVHLHGEVGVAGVKRGALVVHIPKGLAGGKGNAAGGQVVDAPL